MNENYKDLLEEGRDCFSNFKYKMTVSANDESYQEPAAFESSRGHGRGSSSRNSTGARASGTSTCTTTTGRKMVVRESTNSSTKIGDLVYTYGEKLISERPRLSKMATELFSEAYGLLQKMSIRSRRGKRANLAAFFTLYISSKKLKLGVDPVLLAMDVGLTCKDTINAIEEFIPDLNTTSPLELEILDLIYRVEITDIMDEYVERMSGWMRTPRVVDPPLVDFWKRICDLFSDWDFARWKTAVERALIEMTNEQMHVVSPQKIYVLVIYSVIRGELLKRTDHPEEKNLQRLFSFLWGHMANNLEKTRRKTVENS